jgi:hypothetical protein
VASVLGCFVQHTAGSSTEAPKPFRWPLSLAIGRLAGFTRNADINLSI